MPVKKKPNRTAKSTLLVRCTAEQKEVLEAAIEKLRERLPTGASITLNAFALHAALERAKMVLGSKA